MFVTKETFLKMANDEKYELYERVDVDKRGREYIVVLKDQNKFFSISISDMIHAESV